MLENRINGMICILLPVLVHYLSLQIFPFYFSDEGPPWVGQAKTKLSCKGLEGATE